MKTKETRKRNKQRIVWAVDPFEENSETRSHVLKALQEFRDQDALVEPIYVLNPAAYAIDLEFNAQWLEQIRPEAQKVLDHYLEGLGIEGLKKGRVIIERRPSLTRAVLALGDYAKSTKADAALVGTRQVARSAPCPVLVQRK